MCAIAQQSCMTSGQWCDGGLVRFWIIILQLWGGGGMLGNSEGKANRGCLGTHGVGHMVSRDIGKVVGV